MSLSFSFPKLVAGLAMTVLPMALSSCFTGIEGTQKIGLTKEDRKVLMPSAEEEFFKPVSGKPLEEWERGKIFIAADNKALLIFEQEGLPTDHDKFNIGGKQLAYEGIESKLAPDGSYNAVILFNCEGETLRFDTGKNLNEAPKMIFSDKIPMLIDEDMVQSARALLSGKKLWIRSPLWYDEEGNRISGLKYVPVTILGVESGTIAFPLKVRFKDQSGKEAWAMMNFGNSGKESRSFANLFYLSDLKDRYPQISDDVWQLINAGKVRTGMTKEECKLSLGNPTEVDSGHDYTQTLDLWHYSDGAVLWFEDGFLTRYRL